MNTLRQMAKQLLTACLPAERLIARGPSAGDGCPCIALTFDDGPHPEWTPRVLDRLDKLGLRATFYVIGSCAERFPQLIQRIVASGHEIGNHTYSHSEPSQTSAVQFLDEIRRTDELLLSITGRITRTVRPPKGELNWKKLFGSWQCQKTIALWNIDPKDYRMQSDVQMQSWVESYQPCDGDIVLLHDDHPYACQALELLAAKGTFERFHTSTISNWLNRGEN